MSNELEQENINQVIESSETETVQKSNKNRSFYTDNGLFWFVLFFGLFFVTFVFVFQVLLTPIKVLGTSMRPTINNSALVKGENDEEHSDIVYYSKNKEYKNNDIVIVSNNNYVYHNNSTINFIIKRVIAVGGQQIEFKHTSKGIVDGEIRYYYTIKVLDSLGNDTHLNQSYLDEEMYFTEIEMSSTSYPKYNMLISKLFFEGTYTITVSENHYFVMGDNRNNSTDSRFFGEVAYEDISGSVKLIVPYGKSIFASIWQTIFSTKYIINSNFKYYNI